MPTGKARIPAGNPFKGKAGHRGAIWMFGLRNPWKFSFDRATKDMWIGDVGQGLFEEIDFAAQGQPERRELGLEPARGQAPVQRRDAAEELRAIRSSSAHTTTGDCAIIGGYVYRGAPKLPLVGAYVYGDECTGVIRALVQQGGRVKQNASLGLTVSQLSSFGQGPKGGHLRGVARRHDLPARARADASVDEHVLRCVEPQLAQRDDRRTRVTSPRARRPAQPSRSRPCPSRMTESNPRIAQ